MPGQSRVSLMVQGASRKYTQIENLKHCRGSNVVQLLAESRDGSVVAYRMFSCVLLKFSLSILWAVLLRTHTTPPQKPG